MKKRISLLLALAFVAACVGCGSKGGSSEVGSAASGSTVEGSSQAGGTTEGSSAAGSTAEDGSAAESVEESSSAGSMEASGAETASAQDVMTYEEYMAADLDSQVTVETYVQAKQSWWEDKATVYSQDENGAYFLYNMACSEEDYEKLTPGTKIRVTGYKSEWSGEIEITDATFEIVDGNFVAEAKDVTEYLGQDELNDFQNQFVAFKGLVVEAAGKGDDGQDVAFLYNWDGSGQDGDDLYFNVSNEKGDTFTFTVESYLCDNTTDVYAAVKELNIGDKIDLEGFMYWYEGPNPHITSVTPAE